MKQLPFSKDNAVLKEVFGFGVPICKVYRPKNTQAKSFGFEGRNQGKPEKKSKKTQPVSTQEKKIPVGSPRSTIKFPQKSSDIPRISTDSLGRKGAATHFRAKSPSVLKKMPFKPILKHIHSTPKTVKLNTELRSMERKEFEFQQVLREERLAIEREQNKRKEEEEIARLRQESVHRARPMPNFKPPLKAPLSPIPLTRPRSPNFSRRLRNRNTNLL